MVILYIYTSHMIPPPSHAHGGPCSMEHSVFLHKAMIPIGFAEPSESYIFVRHKSIIELSTLRLVTVSELLSHSLSLGVIQKLYTYAS